MCVRVCYTRSYTPVIIEVTDFQSGTWDGRSSRKIGEEKAVSVAK